MDRRKRDLFFGLTVTFIFSILLFISCDSPTSETPEKEKDIIICQPAAGDVYNNYDNIIIITKFLPENVGVDLRRKYSTDGGATFNPMHYEKIESRYGQSDDTKYRYEVVRWKLAEDSLQSVQVYIQIASYGDQSNFDMVGPITIN